MTLTPVVVDKDVLVALLVLVVVAVADDDGEGVCARGGRVAAVLHDDRQVVVLLVLPVKRPLRCHDS